MSTHKFYLSFILWIVISGLSAQTLSDQIDSLFMNLNTADMSTGILYDKCMKAGRADYYKLINDSTATKNKFQQLLLEMHTCNSAPYKPILSTS